MNFVSKLTLISCATMLAATVLSGCGSTKGPDLSDNPNPPAMSGTGSQSQSVSGTATNTNELSSIPAAAARFQSGETVNITSSTGSDLVPGPIPATPQSYLIADDGTISLPLVGTVQAAGKTPGELQRILTKLYVPEYYVRLAVTVTAINRVYYVGGEVTKPGPQEYLGQTTVTRAIQAAGDFTIFANHKKVWLTRFDGTRIQVNVDKALQDSESDPQVFPGDQIQVFRRSF
ncbi:MAG TPA: polysaccharide biosynthesis/export family protein [Verrucomicrobiae bacterium]|jgi:polysaccharide export outer membrane protein|nr:polysaccharide biosynthesis/export family protein [Verrucomicrobiae bacterium]